MKKILPIIAFSLFTCFMFSQGYKTVQIKNNDGTTTSALAKLDYNNDKLITGLIFKSIENDLASTFNLKSLNHLTYGEKKYVTKSFNSRNYLFEEIISGELSMYKSRDRYFLIKDELQLREVPLKYKNSYRQNLNYGIISVFINDCQSTQDFAYSKNSSITPIVLEKIVTDYNNCSKSEGVSMATQAINDATIENDKIGFGISVGYALLNADFNNFAENTEASINTPTIGAKLFVYTNALNNGLFFNFTADYFLAKEQNITPSITSKTSFLSGFAGINYQYKSNNKTFTPFIGVNGGLLMSTGSKVNEKQPSYDLVYDVDNVFTFNIHLGTFIHVFKQKIEADFIYQPTMKFNLDNSSSITGDLNRSYDVSGMHFKISYCF